MEIPKEKGSMREDDKRGEKICKEIVEVNY